MDAMHMDRKDLVKIAKAVRDERAKWKEADATSQQSRARWRALRQRFEEIISEAHAGGMSPYEIADAVEMTYWGIRTILNRVATKRRR